MSNFSFIPATWSALAETPQEAEQHVYGAPLYSAMLCRKSLEEWVRWMYQHDEDLKLPYDTSLSSLIHNEGFKRVVAPSHFTQINLIRKQGNAAVHSAARIKPDEALYSLRLLHSFIGWVTLVYGEEKPEILPFDENSIPKETGKDKSKEELQRLELAFHEQQDELKKLQQELERIKAIKEHNIAFIPPPVDPNEDLTRRMYVNTLLREAGWDLDGLNVAEYPVSNCMPSDSGNEGNGKVDYVLWGDDGKPLALVEAKRTRRDPRVGQHQAKLYADCLEKEFGQRPVIFYSNGFKTWIWDDLNYPPRAVHGFYTRDELQTLIQRRTFKKPLAAQVINEEITDRFYQHEAIREVTAALERNQREALLVMATGTGKTRVSASIIDFLSKAGWVKRVLFLADRNALVHQAKTNLNSYLPNLPAVDLTREKEDESSRIVFSTYQTMIHLIDGETDGINRFYSVGHFDLIIFDEIHRSVYNRYKYIFRYFDGIRIGLTATPKAETHRDTYDLFDLEPNNPTYAYELEQAVGDGFLVPPRGISVPVRFHRQGIVYADLSPDEKLQYEEHFEEPVSGLMPGSIDSAALNKWLFNADTVDKIIGYVMEHGIKVEGGDKLAKTIIFSRNHEHAKFIESRFNQQYPQHKGEFLKVIDNQEEYRYDILNKFKDKNKLPQIAVSVDMLDTGIDVPEVCNLVLYRPVRSSTKFWQMIGRGTRLCKDLFGPGDDKKEFLIFDFCGNFEFFSVNPRGIEQAASRSLSQRLFELRLRLALALLNQDESTLKEYGQSLIDSLIKQTQALNTQSFIVRQHWELVEKYRDPNRWNALSDLEIKELFSHIAPLMDGQQEHEMAKRFDALMLELQHCMLSNHPKAGVLMQQVISTAGKLSKKASIPAVAQKLNVIREVQHDQFPENTSINAIERIRLELREIIKFLDKENTQRFYTMFEDHFDGPINDQVLFYPANDLEVYRQKMQQYLQDARNNLIIQKLRGNIPITRQELSALESMLFEQGNVGTREMFVKAFGDQPLGAFIRNILGMDANAAKEAFGEILKDQTLNSQQIRFINTIINFFITEGRIDPEKLFESPFTDINSNGMLGLFDEGMSTRIIRMIEQVNSNAEVG